MTIAKIIAAFIDRPLFATRANPEFCEIIARPDRVAMVDVSKSVTSAVERALFWWRTRRLAREVDIALQLRRRGRPKRQRAARKGAATKFKLKMEGLKR